MTEIEGKKYYTWDEIRAMPLGTRFRLPWWEKDEFVLLNRGEDGNIKLINQDGKYTGYLIQTFLIQDRIEIVEDKPEREYVTGCQALEKLISGEWEKIACDEDEDWIKRDFITLSICKKFFVNKEGNFLTFKASFIEPRYLKLKKWYEYKGQQ